MTDVGAYLQVRPVLPGPTFRLWRTRLRRERLAPTTRLMAGEFHEGNTAIVDPPEDAEGYTFTRKEKVAAAAAS